MMNLVKIKLFLAAAVRMPFDVITKSSSDEQRRQYFCSFILPKSYFLPL